MDLGERNLLINLEFIRYASPHYICDFNERWDYYSDIATILRQKNNLDDDKIILNNMVGFRNCLSHEYLSLEVNVLTDILKIN